MIEEFKAIFVGRDTIFSGYFKTDGKKVHRKIPNKVLPMFRSLDNWVFVHDNVANIIINYEERYVFDLFDGRTKEKIRIYFYDFDTLQPYNSKMNESSMRMIDSLLAERNFLFSLTNELDSMLKTAGMQDLIKEKFKRDYDYFTSTLKPMFFGGGGKDDKKKK